MLLLAILCDPVDWLMTDLTVASKNVTGLKIINNLKNAFSKLVNEVKIIN